MYNVCASTGGLPGLIEMVNKAIKDGWKPTGGIAADQGYYFQAIIKDENIVNNVMNPHKQEQGNYGKGNRSTK